MVYDLLALASPRSHPEMRHMRRHFSLLPPISRSLSVFEYKQAYRRQQGRSHQLDR